MRPTRSHVAVICGRQKPPQGSVWAVGRHEEPGERMELLLPGAGDIGRRTGREGLVYVDALQSKRTVG